MVQLILYAVLAAGAVAALWGVNEAIGDHYRAPLEVKIAAAEKHAQEADARFDEAALANTALKASIGAATEKCKAAADEVAAIQRRADAQALAAKDAIARAATAARNSAAEVERLRNQAKTVTPGDKAAQCAMADGVLTELARDRRAP